MSDESGFSATAPWGAVKGGLSNGQRQHGQGVAARANATGPGQPNSAVIARCSDLRSILSSCQTVTGPLYRRDQMLQGAAYNVVPLLYASGSCSSDHLWAWIILTGS